MDSVAAIRRRVELARTDGERAQALTDLASALYEYDAGEAVTVAKEAIELCDRLGDAHGLAWARHHLAWSLNSLGRLDEAMTEQLGVLAQFEALRDQKGIGHALMALGDLHGEAGDTSAALDFLERAAKPLEAAEDDVGRGVLCNLTGIALSYEGRHEEAASHFQRAEEVFQSLGDQVRISMAKINQAFELLTMAGPDSGTDARLVKARSLATEAIERGRELGDDGRSTIAYGLSLMARVRGAEGDLDSAVALSEEGETAARSCGFDLLAFDIAVDRIGWLTGARRLHEARSHFDRLAATQQHRDSRRLEARLVEAESNLLEAEGDYAGALAALRSFHLIDGELHTDAAERRARLTSARFEVETARRETELAQLRIAELEALDHEKRDFLASVSHELRTPLAAVLGFATELSEQWDNFAADEARGLVNLIARQSADISSIVDDLLTITRLEAGTMKVYPVEVELAEQLTGLVTTLGREAGREIACLGSSRALADPNRLRQIVRNLVTNAFRYGGPVVRVAISDNPPTIEVRDTGGPIPANRVTTMFDPFDHADDGGRTPNSVGLGLAVARSLALMMEGDLVYEFDGKESVFRLTLRPPPLATEFLLNTVEGAPVDVRGSVVPTRFGA